MPDSMGTGDLYLSDVSPGDKPWDEHRVAATQIECLYRQAATWTAAEIDFNRYGQRIRECAQLLGFAFEVQETGDYKLRLRTAQFCRVRHCPVCQWRRSLMWRGRFLKALPRVIEAHPTHRWIFLTLTVRNCPLEELRGVIGEMSKAWGRLSQRKQFPAVGWARSLEVTRGNDDSVHPHFHVLLMVRPSYFSRGYLSQAEWTKLWQQALRVSYTPIVHVRAVKSKRGGDEAGSAIAIAILETIKYAVKPSDLAGSGKLPQQDAEWLGQLTQQMFKTRGFNVGGILRDYIRDSEPEDLIHDESEELELSEEELRVLFGWKAEAKRYRKVSK